MLRESFEYLLTPCAPVFRKLGYLKELVAIEARYRRIGSHWKTHQERTCRFIMESITGDESRSRAVVLGAGLLLDIPLKILSENFAEVVLVDVVFSRAVRVTIQGYPNVRLLEQDINGLAYPLMQCERYGALPVPQPGLPFSLEQGDLLLSINILSQLALLPLKYARKHITTDEEILTAWASRIVQSHVEWLQQQEVEVVLISDVEHHVLDKNNKLVERYDCLYGNHLPTASQSWYWTYAPKGELVRSYSLDALVEAHRF